MATLICNYCSPPKTVAVLLSGRPWQRAKGSSAAGEMLSFPSALTVTLVPPRGEQGCCRSPGEEAGPVLYMASSQLFNRLPKFP